MKVLLHSDMQKAIARSGVGRAMKHQIMALEAEGIEYTLNPKDDYDILHINTVFPQSYLRAEQARREGKAVVYHAHSTEEDFRDSFVLSNAISPAFKRWIKICYSTAHLILTPTEYSKSLLEAYDMEPPIEVVSNGIDVGFWQCSDEEKSAFRKKYGLTSDEKIVISVGLQIKRKGILDFIDLAKKLPEYHFIWFGYTNPKFVPEEIQEAIQTKLPNLTFAGYVPRGELRIAYRASDLYLFLTYEETEGIVLLEALASEANVLVRDIPVFGEPYVDGVNVYKASTLEEFEKKIVDIVEKKVPPLTKEGYAIAEARSIQNVGKRLRQCYEMALVYKNEEIFPPMEEK